MFKHTKKILSILMMVMMLIGCFSIGFSAFAADTIVADGSCGENANWKLTDDGTLTIYGSGNMNDFTSNTIPYDQYKSKAKKIVIENGITRIGNYAFYWFNNTRGDLVIPDSVVSIGKYAFRVCGFNGSLTLGDHLTKIEESAFDVCKFTGQLSLPSSLKIIEADAFNGCNFTGDLIIPDSVVSVGRYAFANCRKFDGILKLSNQMTVINSGIVSNCKLVGNITIPDSVTKIDYNAFYNCSGFNGQLIFGNSLKTIKSDAFKGCVNLTGKLNLPASVTEVGDNAFLGCADNTDPELFFEDYMLTDIIVNTNENNEIIIDNIEGLFSNYITTVPANPLMKSISFEYDHNLLDYVTDKIIDPVTTGVSTVTVTSMYGKNISKTFTVKVTSSIKELKPSEKIVSGNFICFNEMEEIEEELEEYYLGFNEAPFVLADANGQKIRFENNPFDSNSDYTLTLDQTQIQMKPLKNRKLIEMCEIMVDWDYLEEYEMLDDVCIMIGSTIPMPYLDLYESDWFDDYYERAYILVYAYQSVFLMPVNSDNYSSEHTYVCSVSKQDRTPTEKGFEFIRSENDEPLEMSWDVGASECCYFELDSSLDFSEENNYIFDLQIGEYLKIKTYGKTGNDIEIIDCIKDNFKNSDIEYKNGGFVAFDPYGSELFYMISTTDDTTYLIVRDEFIEMVSEETFDGILYGMELHADKITPFVFTGDVGTEKAVTFEAQPLNVAYTITSAVVEDPTIASFKNGTIRFLSNGTTKLHITAANECGDVFEQVYLINATGAGHAHDPGEPIHENDIYNAKNGTYMFELNTYCQIDGELVDTARIVLDRTPAVEAVPGTDGNIEYFTDDKGTDDPSDDVIYVWNDDTDKYVSYDGDVTIHVHNPGEFYEVARTEPTCTQNGVVTLNQKCQSCGEILNVDYETLDASGHKDANNDGKCDECGKEMSRNDPAFFLKTIRNFFAKILEFFRNLFSR